MSANSAIVVFGTSMISIQVFVYSGCFLLFIWGRRLQSALYEIEAVSGFQPLDE